ncbi:MAG: PH domain-containing protein [Paenisporosarcina sp.]
MPTLEEIKNQINMLDGASRLLGIKEIKELPNILWENENVEKLVSGFYAGGNGILVATNKRVLFVNKGLVYGLKVEDFPYTNISSIEYSTGMLLGKIKFYVSGNKAEIDNVDKKMTREFAEYVRARITKPSEKAPTKPINSSNDISDVFDEIRKYKSLMDDGIITENDFNEKKKQLLGI